MRRAAALACLVAAAGGSLAAAGPAGDDARVAADRPAEPDGLLVLAVVGGRERALVADPRTGATTARELPGGTFCHGPLLAVGGHVVYSGSRHGRFVALSAPLGRLGRTRSLGRADMMAASSTPGRLWLGRRNWSGDPPARATLREVDAGGRAVAGPRRRDAGGRSVAGPRRRDAGGRAVAGPRRREAGGSAVAGARQTLSGWGWLVAAVDGGLLIERGHGLVLRRPGRPRVRLPGGWPLATGAGRVAWCRGKCRRVRVWSDRSERTLDPPAGIRPEQAGRPSISPDGSRLALPVSTPRGARVAVVDLERGAWTIVPGSRTGGYRATAWSPSGRWLYFAGRRHGVRASRAGTGRATRLPIRTGGTVMSIASTA